MTSDEYVGLSCFFLVFGVLFMVVSVFECHLDIVIIGVVCLILSVVFGYGFFERLIVKRVRRKK